ncbi:MAG: hypothetical protein ACTSYC_12115 [Promethearchaeota archaeon]
MEKQKKQVKEISKELKEKTENEIARLREELARLRALKRQRELLTQQDSQEMISKEESKSKGYEEIEGRLKKIENVLSGQLVLEDQKTYEQHEDYVESELQVLEKEIIGETGLIEKELAPYELLKRDYPWLEEPRYEFMYAIPNKKKNPNDYQSWREEWAKVLFDYSRYAVLHILYLKQLYAEKPFSKFQNRKQAIDEIIEELIGQDLAKWLSKKKDKVRIYWKSLDSWAEEIYDWAVDNGILEPILLHEIRAANKEFSTLPQEDINEIFKMLAKSKKAVIIKLDGGRQALKIEID